MKENKIYRFYDQVKQEALKVAWLGKKELITSTVIVSITVVIFSLICLILDYGIHSIMQVLLHIG